MRSIVTSEESRKLWRTFLHGFVGGVGWLLGLTVGFSILAFIITQVMTTIGGIPLIGQWLADIIEATEIALERRL